MDQDAKDLKDLLVALRAKREREEQQRAMAAAAPMHAEGRRGRQRRELLAVAAPDELPTPRTPATTTSEQIKLTNRENREQIEKLVHVAAHAADVYPDAAGRVLGCFFEAMAVELVAGRCVPIPGVGAFCARPSRPHPRRKQRCYLAFTAARNLGVRICEWAVHDPVEYRRWENFRINHRPSGRCWRAIAESPEDRVRKAWRLIGRRQKERAAS